MAGPNLLNPDWLVDLSVRQQEDNVLIYLALREAFLSLPDKHLVVLGLLNNGFAQKEVASILGVSRTSVGTTKKAAMTMLLRAMREHIHEP